MFTTRNTWVARVQQRQVTAQHSTTPMYSVAGAIFQEYALAHLDYRGSIAHSAIGRLVTAINQGAMPVDVAQAIYNGLIGK